uniref:Secreted protein n=1 Tax=Steinernema glaseri TaxID=37863 RepID=A0A1I7YL13_9BILA
MVSTAMNSNRSDTILHMVFSHGTPLTAVVNKYTLASILAVTTLASYSKCHIILRLMFRALASVISASAYKAYGRPFTMCTLQMRTPPTSTSMMSGRVSIVMHNNKTAYCGFHPSNRPNCSSAMLSTTSAASLGAL